METLLKLQKNLEKALTSVNQIIDQFDETIVNEDKIKSKFDFKFKKKKKKKRK